MRVSHGLGRFVGMCLLLAPLFVLAAGCGKGGVVSGKVYYKGKPVTRGTVNFYPEGKGGNYASLIEPDGSYSIAKIPPGPAKITVMVGMSGPPPGLGMRGGPRSADRAAQGMKQMERVAKSEGADS